MCRWTAFNSTTLFPVSAKRRGTLILCQHQFSSSHTVSQPNTERRSDFVGPHLFCDQWDFGSRCVCSLCDLWRYPRPFLQHVTAAHASFGFMWVTVKNYVMIAIASLVCVLHVRTCIHIICVSMCLLCSGTAVFWCCTGADVAFKLPSFWEAGGWVW